MVQRLARWIGILGACSVTACLGGVPPSPIEPSDPQRIVELSEDQLDATGQSLTRYRGEPPVDIWPYVAAIEPWSPDLATGVPAQVYRNGSGTFLHVLVRSADEVSFQVLVIDAMRSEIRGHRRIRPTERYGMQPPRSVQRSAGRLR